jgi:2-oxo-4-hydroxy-4-carboxy--5-ureidoimidazoline (OHCU) decarboxylase
VIDFSRLMGLLFEPAPAFAARLAARRPFDSNDHLLAEAAVVAHGMPPSDQVELINAHPRLAATSELSAASRREQGSADPEADRKLTELQTAYEARFGFRYLAFVAGRTRRALIPDLQRSLSASREAEMLRAIDDTLAIAADRLTRLRPGTG